MSSRCERLLRNPSCACWLLVAVLGLTLSRALWAQSPDPQRVLHIAADPNNLPFSNDRLEGFENKIAELVAHDLNARVEYTWHAQRRGFFRQTLKEGDTDLVMGVPAGFERALTTQPYYRSSYVFVYRKDKGPRLASLDDPLLHTLKVGVQLVGNDGVDTPPAHALARRGIITNVVGYTLYGDYRQPNPPARIVDAVAQGAIDVALAWGPLAGYFAQHESVPLEVVAVSQAQPEPTLRFSFSISMGVRKRDRALRDSLNQILVRRRAEIDRILDGYGVPRVGFDSTEDRGSPSVREAAEARPRSDAQTQARADLQVRPP